MMASKRITLNVEGRTCASRETRVEVARVEVLSRTKRVESKAEKT